MANNLNHDADDDADADGGGETSDGPTNDASKPYWFLPLDEL